MSGRLQFLPGERARVESREAELREAMEAAGLTLPSHGRVHAAFHRWLIRQVRSATGARPRHAESAAHLLRWSRERGDVALYAMAPMALAVVEAHGRQALSLDPTGSLERALSLLADIAPVSSRSGGARKAA